jgi:hypothetical protein
VKTNITFEEYAHWAASRYPGYLREETMTPTEAAVYAPTIPPAPDSSEACPVTVKSATHGTVIVTPVPKGSR